MPEVRVQVPAKVNLALAVGGTDADGYHELVTIFQAISLFDDIHARSAPAGEFRLSFRGEGAAFLPTDETNLAVRAARAVASRFELGDAGVEMVIRKRIPVAGGMAGGSADAAGVLVACNELWGCGAGQEDLLELGRGLGADVPFCLVGGTALGTGRGDELIPVLTKGTYHWVVALSHSGLSTPSVFRKFDKLVPEPPELRGPDELMTALNDGDVTAVGAALTNDLQPAALELQPLLAATLEIGRAAGALGSLISGSGPSCAFLAEDADAAARIADALALFSGVRAVRVAHGPVPGAQVTG